MKSSYDYRNSATLVHVLNHRALLHPDRTAFIFLKDGENRKFQLSYEELDRRARAVAARLQSLNVAGERALVFCPSGLDYIVAFFGCLYAGGIAVPSYPPRPNRPMPRIQSIVSNARAKFALTTTDILSNLEKRFKYSPYLASLEWLAVDQFPDGLENNWKEPPITGDTLAFLQYTSGSTSDPRGVMVTHGNILYDVQIIQNGMQSVEESVIVGWLPFFHDMGLIKALHPFCIGATCVIMPPEAFLQRPVRWLQAITRYKGDLSGAPNFAYDLCVEKITSEQRAELDLSSWRVAFNGAEPVRHETIKKFTHAFASQGFKREAFYPCYGLAEATLMVTGGYSSSPPVIRTYKKRGTAYHRVNTISSRKGDIRIMVGCGRALLDEKILIVNPDTQTECHSGELGEIWVSGPNIAQGYWNNSKETEKTFRGYLSNTLEGPFLRTGDLGIFQDDELFIMGRIKDLIIIQGNNYYPQDIEDTVKQCHPALRHTNNAAFSIDIDGSEKLIVVQELKRHWKNVDPDEVITAIRWAVPKEHGIRVSAVVLLRAHTIPMTSSGKIMRYACRKSFLDASLNIIKEWRAPIPSLS